MIMSKQLRERRKRQRLQRKIQHSCRDKIAIKIREEAEVVLAVMLSRSMPSSRPLNIYTCKYCGDFHIGHLPARFLD